MSSSTIGRRKRAIQGALGVARRKTGGGWVVGQMEKRRGDRHHLTLCQWSGSTHVPTLAGRGRPRMSRMRRLKSPLAWNLRCTKALFRQALSSQRSTTATMGRSRVLVCHAAASQDAADEAVMQATERPSSRPRFCSRSLAMRCGWRKQERPIDEQLLPRGRSAKWCNHVIYVSGDR